MFTDSRNPKREKLWSTSGMGSIENARTFCSAMEGPDRWPERRELHDFDSLYRALLLVVRFCFLIWHLGDGENDRLPRLTESRSSHFAMLAIYDMSIKWNKTASLSRVLHSSFSIKTVTTVSKLSSMLLWSVCKIATLDIMRSLFRKLVTFAGWLKQRTVFDFKSDWNICKNSPFG